MTRILVLVLAFAHISASSVRAHAWDEKTRGSDDRVPSAGDLSFFESKIRPLFATKCDKCHSAAAKTLRGGLRLDYRGGWETGGDNGPAIVPGKPDESLLIQAVRYDDELLRMPPDGKLEDAELHALEDWVRRGAPDPRVEASAAGRGTNPRTIDVAAGKQHWAFQPLRAPETPRVNQESLVFQPLDRFILQKLDAAGLKPAREADRRVMARRLWFDLLGLPPTPHEMEAFLQDPASDAYERLVDRLLESPHFGERWARHWLDLARWAESHGFEHDYDRPTAYPYRDFVIEALNRDLPFNTFVKWQLAGDEYAPDNPLALAATGFIAAGTHSTQITANQVEKERYDELDDMLATTGTAFLGLTIGCARCHDHKFDPIPQSDYYRLLSTFTTTIRSEFELPATRDEQVERYAKWQRERENYTQTLRRFEREHLPARLLRWVQDRAERSSTGRAIEPPAWVILDPSKLESPAGTKIEKIADGFARVVPESGPSQGMQTLVITGACDLAELAGLRLELRSDAVPDNRPSLRIASINLEVGPRYGIGASRRVRLGNAKSTLDRGGSQAGSVVDGESSTIWSPTLDAGTPTATAVFEIDRLLRTDSGSTLRIEIQLGTTSPVRMRLAATDSPLPIGIDDDGVPLAVREILAKDEGARSEREQDLVLSWYRTIDAEHRSLRSTIEDHALLEPTTNPPKALISSEGMPPLRLHTQGADFFEKTYFLKRGDPQQKAGEAEPSFLQVLMPSVESEARWRKTAPPGSRTSWRRRSLAEWMTDTDSGAGRLVARVAVNRLWLHLFGKGIVVTPSDFGAQGERPTHPELLDHLATELIEGGWRLKPVLRQILLSHTYRQSSLAEPSALATDPENRLVSRQNRRRLEAETVRDAILEVSGMLDPRMLGPGTLDDRSRRRSIYLTVKRSRMNPMLALFDAPDYLVPLPARSSTVIAPQALLFMNSPWIREASARFADRVRPRDGQTLDDAIILAYRLALSRVPTANEHGRAAEFLEGMRLNSGKADSADAGYTGLEELCQILLCLNEFIYID
jgi:hypothetical protein